MIRTSTARTGHFVGTGRFSSSTQLSTTFNCAGGKLLESETLQQQAANNTKKQFSSSPNLNTELTEAIMDAPDAHTTMSRQALNSPAGREG
jgi:type I restriction enzyme R subunit